ncbi:hypothetical protein Tco_0909711 [Tanacetum coccineum]|uniref:Uncharacterized protein n=1 Tax=Tanacetum coccineum TaxID=301880 RepID=A0ABQ5CQS1_9ASTR
MKEFLVDEQKRNCQVVLDALALTLCYLAFLITADVPEVYMHQFWNCIYKHDDFYRFKIDKKKRFKLTLEVFRDIFQIFPRVPGRDFDALPSEEDTISFLRDLGHTRVINSLNDVVIDQMHQPWRTFAAIINICYWKGLVDFTNFIFPEHKSFGACTIRKKSISWRNRIGMHTSKDDYLINTLRFVSRKEASQIYRAVLPECLTSPEMKESKAYKTYLGYATGEVPPKVARKFKKASPSKKESELVPGDEEPVKKLQRLKTPTKKSASKPTTGIIIREPPVETKSKRKEKEKVDVAHGKGIELLSEVALSEKAQMKEARKKSLRDFHKTHPSGSGMVAEKPPSVEKITPTVTSEGTGDKPGVPDVTNDDSSESESESWANDERRQQVMKAKIEEFDQENESEDDEMKRIVQGEGNDTEMTEAQQGNENLETTQEQVVEDAHVTISTVLKKRSPYVHVHHEVPRTQAPTLLTIPVLVIPESSRLEKESWYDLRKNPLHTQVTSLVDSHLDTRLEKPDNNHGNLLSESLTARIKEQVKDQLPQILPQEVSNFTPPVIEKLIKESRDEVTLAKVSSEPQSTYEDAFRLTEFELKKILLDKMEKSDTYLTAPEHRDCYDGLKKSYALDKDFFYSYDVYSLKRGQNDKDKDEDPSAGSDGGLKKRKTSKDTEPTTSPKKKDSTSESSKGTKSQPKSTRKYVQSEEPVFEVADSDMPQDQAGNLGDNEDEPMDKTASRCDDYPFDLSKPLPLITHGNRQRVPFEFFINNDLKYLQGGISTLTYTTSTTKTKAAQYDLLGIKDMVQNIWSLVKIAYDKYALWVLAEEKMEQFGKEKSSFHDQGHQQAVKGKKDDEEFGENSLV